MLPQDIESQAAVIDEFLKVAGHLRFAGIDDIDHIVGEKKRCPIPETPSIIYMSKTPPKTFLPFESAKRLRITQVLSEIDMQHVTSGRHQYVVVVPITYAQDVCGYTPSSAG